MLSLSLSLSSSYNSTFPSNIFTYAEFVKTVMKNKAKCKELVRVKEIKIIK